MLGLLFRLAVLLLSFKFGFLYAAGGDTSGNAGTNCGEHGNERI
jgi:hypothetical protein